MTQVIGPIGSQASHYLPGKRHNNARYRTYPKMTLQFCAPIELENLLPEDIRYSICGKHPQQQCRTHSLRGGEHVHIHHVRLDEAVLFNVGIKGVLGRCVAQTPMLLILPRNSQRAKQAARYPLRYQKPAEGTQFTRCSPTRAESGPECQLHVRQSHVLLKRN